MLDDGMLQRQVRIEAEARDAFYELDQDGSVCMLLHAGGMPPCDEAVPVRIGTPSRQSQLCPRNCYRNGTIEQHELAGLLALLNPDARPGEILPAVADEFALADLDGDGKLTFEEFVIYYKYACTRALRVRACIN